MGKKEIITTENDFGSDEFAESITPKKIKDSSDLFLFRCPECKGVHFRHAGYLETMMPFIRADKQKRVDTYDNKVMVCVKCRKCYIWCNEQAYDVSTLIDLEAWEKAERELNRATGPGGEC